MTEKVVIRVTDWHRSCGEPRCCDEYGTTLLINDVHVTDNYEGYPSDVQAILKAVGIESEIEYGEDE